MNFNRLATLVIIGAAVSLTAACNGGPTKPSAMAPSFGDGAAVASVNVSNINPVGAVNQVCTGQPNTSDGEDQAGETSNADAPVITCDSPANAQPQADEAGVVVSDSPSMESARFASHLYR